MKLETSGLHHFIAYDVARMYVIMVMNACVLGTCVLAQLFKKLQIYKKIHGFLTNLRF